MSEHEFERQPPMCREPRDPVRTRRRGNRIKDDSAKELSESFGGYNDLLNSLEDREIVNTNAERLAVYLEAPRGMKVEKPNKVFKNFQLINEQSHYTVSMFVDRRTGLILDIGLPEDVEEKILMSRYTQELVLEVLVDDEAYASPTADYYRYHFMINGKDDPETLEPLPLEMVVDDRAVANLALTEQICNGQNV